MSGDGTPILAISHIKKEVDGTAFLACSPTNSNLYSSSKTGLPNKLEYGDPQEMGCYEVQQSRSPGSPDRQFCSSTTQFIGEVNVHNAEGEVKEEDLPRRLCLVCGDVASGFHYGVASCEACKAFFKRTIQGNIEYTCPAANDCEINKRRRKACQACRFQKCLRMGMLKEGVRLDRVRGGRQKYRRNTDAPYQIQSMPPLKPYLSLEDNKILEALTLNEPDISVTAQDVSNVDPGIRTLNILSDLYDQELVKIITWAKHIPGFLDLTLNDQMRLLQSTWAEILTLTVTYRSLPGTGELKFAADFSFDEKMARECGAMDIYQHCMHIVERQEKLNITKEEYYIIKALVLANSDVRIDDLPPLKKLRDNILSALADCVAVLRPNTTPLHLNHLLLCLPALRQADYINRKFWSTVHREGKVYMNKLFVEMLESYIRTELDSLIRNQKRKMDLMEFEELLLTNNDDEQDAPKSERREGGKRGRKPGRKASDKVDVRAKLERSRQSARECRARKKLRYQYLEELVTDREKAVLALRKELEKYREWNRELDEEHIPDGFTDLLEEMGAIKTEKI